MPAIDPRLMDRLEEERQRQDAEERQARWKPIHYRLDAEQQRLTIDPTADTILATLPEHTRLCQDVLVSHLRHREFPFSVSSTGRFFNGITGLKRELRTALRIDDQPVGAVDIRCAQPALLALAMTQETPTKGLKERATYKHGLPALPLSASGSLLPVPSLSPAPDSFASLVLGGRLYEFLMDKTGLDRICREARVSARRAGQARPLPEPREEAFREAFPSVHAFIRSVNRHDHGELIRHLQRLESWVVIEHVSPRLLGRVPCITLHDAIFSTRVACRLSNGRLRKRSMKSVFDFH